MNSGMDHAVSPSIPLDVVGHILGRTNPTKPGVDVAAFIGELRDFPRLFKVIASSMVKTAGRAYLSYHFGWKQMYRDLAKMVQVGELTSRKLIVLKNLLQRGHSATARVAYDYSFWENSFEDSLTTHEGFDQPVQWNVQGWTETSLWGSTRWYMPADAARFIRQDVDLQKWLSLKTAMGLSLHPASLWEIIPWSWLIDWFIDFEQVLEFYYSRPIPIEFSSGCVMFRRDSKLYVEGPSDLPGSEGPPSFEMRRITKRRDVFSPSNLNLVIQGTVGRFSPYQLSLLAALVATKQKFGRML
nr:MAG: putative maturation protein [Leviviridae sp.]